MPETGRNPEENGERVESMANSPRDLEIPEVLRRPAGAKPGDSRGTGGSDSGMWGMAKAWGVAFDFIFTIIAGAALGWGFDKWRGSEPKGLMTGLILGFVVAFVRIVRATLKQEREEQARKNKR